MKAKYYVNNNKQFNGDHEVHKEGCEFMPLNKKFLGEFNNCEEAVNEAKRSYNQSNGCKYCSKVCHTQ